MTSQVLEIEGTWEEILAQAAKFVGRRVRITVLVDEEEEEALSSNGDENEMLKSAEECFRQGWREAMTGQTIPLSELWEGIDGE